MLNLGMAIARFRRPSLEEPATNYSLFAVGDEVDGGIYVGTFTYSDTRQFHIISAKLVDEVSRSWGPYSATGASDGYDGVANTDLIMASGSSQPAASYCAGFVAGGKEDWYLPSRYELQHIVNTLGGTAEFPNNFPDDNVWSSTESGSSYAWFNRWGADTQSTNTKNNSLAVRPIRRVPV